MSVMEPHTEKLKYIFDNARVGIAICNAEDNTLEMVNPAFAAIHGYEPHELIGAAPGEVFAPECMIRLSEYENSSSCAINDVSFETIHTKKDGSPVPVSVHITVIKDENGVIKQRIANIIDITERKKTESELQTTYEQFTQIYDNSIDIIYLIEVTPEGRFIHLDINPAFVAASGMSREEILGGYVDEFDNKTLRTILLDKYTSCLKAKKRVDYTNDYPLPSGIKTLHSVLTPLFDESGRIYQIVGIARDITEQKNTETLLRQMIEFNEEIINTIPDLLFELDAEGTYLNIWAQDESLLAAQKALLIGKNLSDILPQDVAEICFQTIREVDIEGKSLGNTMYIDLPEGRKWFELSASKKKSSGTYIVLSRDITERKRVEEALRSQSALLQSILESSPDVTIFALDRAYNYLSFNQNHANVIYHIWGHKIAIGMNMLDIIIREDDKQKAKELFDKALAGESFINETEYGDENLSRSYWQTYYAPMIDNNGEIIGLTCFNLNITDKREQELQLHKTKAKLSAVISTIPDLIWVKDVNGVYMMCNPAFENFFGASCGEIIGKTDYDFISKEQADFFRQKDREAMEAGEMRINEEEIVFAHNGQRALLETRKIPVYNGNEFMGVLGIGRDITETRASDNMLHMLKHAVNASNESLFLIKTEQPDFYYVNDTAANILGYSKEELTSGMGVFDIDPDFNDINLWIEHVKMLEEYNGRTFETRHRSKDGRIYPVEVRSTFFTYNNERLIFSTARDISERKKMESEIAKQKDFQNTLLLSIAEAGLGIHVIEEGKYIYTNDIEKAKQYGYDETIMDVKPNFLETIHPDDRAKALDMYTRRLRGEDVPTTYELGVIQTDGIRREHSVSVIVVPNTDPIQTIVVTQDISERKQLEQLMVQNESRLKAAQKIAKVGSWELDFPGLNLSWSDEIYRIFELEPNDFQPSYDYFLNLIHPDDRDYIDTVFANSLKNKTRYDVVHRLLMSDGRIKYVHERGKTLYNEEGDPIRSIGTVQDITEQKVIEKKIEYMAHHDALTGLPNRTLAKARAEQIIAQAKRSDSKAAFLFIDLDGFKAINDSLGHSAGDLMLKTIASRLKECVRECDIISRQGGDEFLLILSDLKEENVIASTTEKILAELEKSFEINEHTLSLSGSIGISIYPDHGENFELLLKNADTAMYKAKETGKNRYHFYTQQMTHNIIGQFKIQNDLKSALENNEFTLFYQPQIDLATNRITGVEALIRWFHPKLGMIPPMNFIPIAEGSGLIVPIGQWVIEEACRQVALWQNMGISISVAVNISAMQFKRGNLEEIVKNALHSSKIDPKQLELELTESVIMHNTETTLEYVHNLKRLGVQLSIDDFGTGYSSLAYLKRFAVDKLKIDQSFVRDILKDQEDAVIVQTIIQMAKNLNLKSIAEGVENADVLSIISNYGCDEVQGYHFAKPMESSAFETYYHEFHSAN